MISIPTDCALHTTNIACDFVYLLFISYVDGRQNSVFPPMELDVRTMLACRQLAQVLADAYCNPGR